MPICALLVLMDLTALGTQVAEHAHLSICKLSSLMNM